MTLRRLFLHNFWLKLMSLALAGLLWLVVQATIHSEASLAPRFLRAWRSREFVRPVLVLTDMAAGRKFAAEPGEVSVEIIGPGAQQLQATDVQAYVELHDPAKLRGDLPCKVLVVVPRGIKLGQVVPETVLIHSVEAP